MNNALSGRLGTLMHHPSAGGVLLIISAILAMVFANTPLAGSYDLLLSTTMEIRIGTFEINKPVLLWVNDGLMALFFFLIGLELKRELLAGELSDLKQIVLPGAGAVGGMLVPALIYVLFNRDNADALQGWAIPAATDIAFALGVLSLLGSRVPPTVKVFLVSLAIFDDIGAIVIIALFYTANISLTALVVVLCCLPVLALLNYLGVTRKSVYLFIGLIMWAATLKSGVHATLAGVVLAMFIPLKSDDGGSPLLDLEEDFHAFVAFLVLPLFAFANAGIGLSGVGLDTLLHPVPLGIAAGLFAGKQLGIFLFCWVAIKAGIASMPRFMSWPVLYGVSALCGIGFTMSLFIGSLAFEESGVNLFFDERLGIIVGSLLSGFAGFMVLKFTLPSRSGK